MSEHIHIIVPSKGRASGVRTNVTGQILVVDKSECGAYREHNAGEIVECPDFNNLAEKRNWILDKFGDAFMLDDDISAVERLYESGLPYVLTPDEAADRIQRTYQQAKNIGVFLFGFNNDGTPAHYNAMKPFMMKGFINGCAIGIISGGGLRFTNKTVAAESHYINLLNAYRNRACLIDKRFIYKQENGSTFLKDGGQTLNRTIETEKRDSLFLRLMFGESVILKKAKNATLQRNEYQRQLKIRL